MSPSYDSKK